MPTAFGGRLDSLPSSGLRETYLAQCETVKRGGGSHVHGKTVPWAPQRLPPANEVSQAPLKLNQRGRVPGCELGQEMRGVRLSRRYLPEWTCCAAEIRLGSTA